MLETRQLRYFVAVAEELHFGRAAARVHIAQPALSRQIQQIERQVGAPLLTRSQRRVELTASGRILLERARVLLADALKAEDDARRAARGEIGRLVVGFIHSSTYGLLPQILRRFRHFYPDVDFDLREMSMAEQAAALSRRVIDIGLTRPMAFDPAISTLPIFREGFLVAVPAHNALASQATIRLAQLAEASFVLFPQRTSPLFNGSIMQMCEKAGFIPRVSQTATQVHTVIGLVSAGLGLAIVPATARNLQISGVAFLQIEDAPPPVSVVLAWRPADDSPAMQAFRATAVSVADRISNAAV